MVYKIKPGDGVSFTQIPNATLQDQDLPIGAKGLLCVMLSKPHDWKFSCNQLAKESKEDRKTIMRYMNQLIDAGYVYRERQRKPGGQYVTWTYTVYHSKIFKSDDPPKTSNPPKSVLPESVKRTTTNKENTNIVPKKELARGELSDPLANQLRRVFISVTPSNLWKNFPQEQKNAVRLAEKLRKAVPDDPEGAGEQLLEYFLAKKSKEKSSYWTDAPFTPSGCLSRWDQLIEGIRGMGEKMKKQARVAEFLNG